MQTAPVPRRARLELGHALVQRLSDSAGLRVLHVKGLAAEAVLPGDGSLSSDVDVLVDPGRLPRFVALLEELPSTEVVSDAAYATEAHALNIFSHGLGVSLDVHGHFPGFRASPQVVFDVLYARSEAVILGQHDCRCPDRVSAAVLGVVHAARNAPGSRAQRQAVARWDALGAQERDDAVDLLRRLRATGAASTVVAVPGPVPRREAALFLAYQRHTGPLTLWLLTLLATPGLRPRLLVVHRALLGGSSLVAGDAAAVRHEQYSRGRIRRAVRSVVPAVRAVAALLREGGRRG